MKLKMTEALAIDLDTETWHCAKCDHALGTAERSYKEGLLVHARDPREIHPSIIDPTRYQQTFAPQPEWVQILEYYCPRCALMMEAEYLPPGHPPVMDMEFNLESLRELARNRSAAASPIADV